jgi:poly(3-hydroxyalkanoate) synthetase
MGGLDEKSHGGNSSDTEKDVFDKSGIANYVPNQRLEWKRYKQYTRNDIMAAIEEVKQGKNIKKKKNVDVICIC